MTWLNYHHLKYFSVIVEEGGLAAAGRKLRISHSTLSAQLKALEAFFGEPLFERKGRRLHLTALGESVRDYANEIFRLGGELVEVAHGQRTVGAPVFRVGVEPGVPRRLAWRFLSAAIKDTDAARVQIQQERLPRLVDALAGGRLHAVLCSEVPPEASARGLHAHLLGESDVWVYGTPELALRFRPGFPASLAGAPFVLPDVSNPLRRRFQAWLTRHGLEINVMGEADDSGMLRVLGEAGLGLFLVRAALRAEVEKAFEVRPLGACRGLRESFFALTGERRVRHPQVAGLISYARSRLEFHR